MGAIASPAGRPRQRNDGNPRGLDDPLLPRGFDLVADVASKLTAYHSHLRRDIRFHLDIHVHVTFIFMFVFVLSFTFIFIFSGAPQESSSS
jgi:hypothetical protein